MFEQLYASALKNELLLISGGMVRFHLRRDRSLVIYEIISIRPGAGSEMLEQLKQVKGAASIFAKCPVDLEANKFYAKKGFICEGQETTKSGRKLNLWRLTLHQLYSI